MIDVDITFRRGQQVYELIAKLGDSIVTIKLDSGAKYTVISARVLNSSLTDKDLINVRNYCENRCGRKEKFISASGHTFDGYLVKAQDAIIGRSYFKEFYYYLVVENCRDIALLGFDFIDNCKGRIEPHSDIIISEFDDVAYTKAEPIVIKSDEIIAFMDSLSLGV